MSLLANLLNLLFPPQCLSCEKMVPAHGTLCLPCWHKVQFISDPRCNCCGLPFEYALGDAAVCGECLRSPPHYAHARAAFLYDEHSRALVLKLKYADQTQLASIYGTWLVGAGRELISVSDLIIPVPLHYLRFVRRRYNQAALLAHIVSRRSGVAYNPDALKRTRNTPPQTGLNRTQRQKNVRGAFIVPPSRKAAVQGKTILLIDDVLTTGTTIDACAKALLNAGAMQVNVLTLARTKR